MSGMADSYEALLENYRNAWQGLRLIREAVETLGPPGVLPSQEAVITLYGPEPIHEAQAIVDALTKILNQATAESEESSPGSHEEMPQPPLCHTDLQRARHITGRVKEPPRRRSTPRP